MRTNLLIVGVALLSLVAGYASHYFAVFSSGASVEHPVSVFEHPPLRSLDGNPQSLMQWKGKVLVLNFWASWCLPCREEMPVFSEMQQAWAKRNLQFLGIAIDDPEEVISFLNDTPVDYPILLGDDTLIDWAGKLGNKAGVLPFSVLVDSQGKIVSTRLGGLSKDALMDWLDPHLSAPGSP